MVNCFAIDPGVTTGWCYMSLDDGLCGGDLAAAVDGGLVVMGEVDALAPARAQGLVSRDGGAEEFVKRHGAYELYRAERVMALTVLSLIEAAHRDGAMGLLSLTCEHLVVRNDLWPADGAGLDGVVMEEFVVYQQKGVAIAGKSWVLSPSRVGAMLGLGVGMSRAIDGCGVRLRTVDLTMQMAGFAKGTATDARLKQWGLWAPGLGHARDAVRHAAVWVRGNTGV